MLRLLGRGDGGGLGDMGVEVDGGAVGSRSVSRWERSVSGEEGMGFETGFSRADVFNDAENAGERGLGGM